MKTILVVDDDKMNLMTAKRILSKQYRVVTVNSGDMALTYLGRNIPDLILLDIKMPNMSGFDVMEKLREKDEWKNIPVIFLTADRDNETEIQCFEIGATDFIVKPFVPAIMMSRIQRTIELESYKKDLEGAIKEQAAEILKKNIKIVKMQREVIVSMANLIESRDGSTGEHVKRTAIFVKLIAQNLMENHMFEDTLTQEYFENVCKAAPMHDIGKITVPDYILKSTGNLSEEEFERMKNHSVEGGKIIRETLGKIEDSKYIEIAADMATYHHEKWDGTGYPEGISGEDIPLCARIMAVADVFDALAFRRYYKEALSLDATFDIIEESSGTHFDPVVTDALCNVRKKIEEMFEHNEFE
ncbi:MAG: response regulator [Lachnospiraceae bacterium]|nr:response regulator [Lachnospiraceae bacterium]